jgi:phosphatidylinositol dimannoside acyltransferase
VRDRITALTYRGASAVAQYVPATMGTGLARIGGRVAYRTMHDRREMTRRHQRRATGFVDERAVRGVFASYARYWFELLRLPADVRREQIQPHFEIAGYDQILAGLEAGKGVILALPHVGQWDFAAAWMAVMGHRMLAVAEAIEPAELYDWFLEQRQAIGLDIVALGPGASSAVLQTLRENRLVCLLADRDITGDGAEVEFFGERTTLPAGPATLALRTGATLLPAAVYFRPRRNHFTVVGAPIPVAREGRLREDVTRITQDLAHRFEAMIREAPEQWHLMQPNWPSDLRPRPRSEGGGG